MRQSVTPPAGYKLSIKNMLKKINFIYLCTVLALLPLISRAQTVVDDDEVTLSPVRLENPLNNIDSIQALLVAILNIVVILMIPVIVFFIILAGFKYVTARGNATQVQEATQALMYAIIGGVLVLGASAISEIIETTVNAF